MAQRIQIVKIKIPTENQFIKLKVTHYNYSIIIATQNRVIYRIAGNF